LPINQVMENINRLKIILTILTLLSVICSMFLLNQQAAISDQSTASIIIQASIQEIKAIPDVNFVKDVIHTIFNVVNNK
jgi:hypothetical protein